MKVRVAEIENFRGTANGRIVFEQHTLLVGGNNIGKSTVCEALELVLGPERLYRRPVIDEHDFSSGRYLDENSNQIEIRIRVILTELTPEQQRRVGWGHLRRWDDRSLSFVGDDGDGLDTADNEGVIWALPVIFLGRYDPEEDDFVGDTFFEHPAPVPEDIDEATEVGLGKGRAQFGRAHKRLVGFVFLRALRTGSRALSLHRGSLLDTILRLGGDGSRAMWAEALDTLENLDPAVGEITQLKQIRADIRTRLGQFVNLAPGDKSAAFYASDLTREHLREIVRLFVATEPSQHLVPFARQGTGSINLLVFALLTIIADLKGEQSVIFVMEEPEIALPPHTQRRVTKFVLHEMGQSIVTSHSPYVIEQFDPSNVVILSRDHGVMTGTPIDTSRVKPKTYRTMKRQFAEAILSRAVLVVEGTTESAVFPAASSVLEAVHPGYTHIDLAGVSVFSADTDARVPEFAPIFKALGKKVYGTWDAPNSPAKATAEEDKRSFNRWWVSPEKGIERMLVAQTPLAVHRRFLDEVANRDDFPKHVTYSSASVDADLAALAFEVLKHRKGEAYGYASSFIGQCQTEAELPVFVSTVLLAIDKDLAEEPELSIGAKPAEADISTNVQDH